MNADHDVNKDGVPPPSPWRPMHTAPKLGNFLVIIEEESHGSRVHVMSRLQGANAVIEVVAGHFAFDMPKATLWHPLPELPREAEPRSP